MPARDIHQDALDIARRYAGPAQGYEEGGKVVPTPSWYDYATGAAGLANRGLMGVPGTVAALGNAALAGATLNNPSDAYWRTQQAATDAADLGTKLYGRDARAMVEEYPGTSMMKGAATAAAHGIGNVADAAQQGIILTLPMAQRIAKKYLHPDDMGGANRMRDVTEHFRANPAQSSAEMDQRLNSYWREHGVAHYPDLNTGNLEPYTSVQAPGHRGLLMREPGSGAGYLEDFYDDPILFNVNPKAREIELGVDVDPTRKHVDQGGGYVPARAGDPASIYVYATSPDIADNILAHEVTHANSRRPSFALPQGSNPTAFPPALSSGATTSEVDTIRKEIDRALAIIHNPAVSFKDRNTAQIILDGLIEKAGISKQMAQYLDANITPGEHLARMEQIFSNMRARGEDPMKRPFTDIDDLDLSHMGPGWDLRRHRIVPRSEE